MSFVNTVRFYPKSNSYLITESSSKKPQNNEELIRAVKRAREEELPIDFKPKRSRHAPKETIRVSITNEIQTELFLSRLGIRYRKNGAPTPPTFFDLPIELIAKIFSYLTPNEIVKSFYVPPKFRLNRNLQILKAHRTWENFLTFSINVKGLPAYKWGLNRPQLFDFLTANGQNLSQLNLRSLLIRPEEVTNVLENCPDLENLSLTLPENAFTTVIPRSLSVLRNLRVLDLSSNKKTLDDVAAALLAALPLDNLLSLNLGQNQIKARGVTAIANSCFARQLQKLDLSYNAIFRGAQYAQAIKALGQFTALQELSLICTRLEDRHIRPLVTVLQPLSSLRRLFLSSNHIATEGASALATLPQPLEELDCVYNPLLGARGLKAITQSPSIGPSIQMLRVSFCGHLREITSVREIFSSPTFSQLRSLELEALFLGDGGIKVLSTCPSLSTVEILKLGTNQITRIGIGHLVTSPHFPNLTQLFLGNNQIQDGGALTLASAEFSSRLTKIFLETNGIGNQGLAAITTLAAKLRLREVNLSNNSITIIDPLLELSGTPNNVKSIHLRNNPLTLSARKIISATLPIVNFRTYPKSNH